MPKNTQISTETHDPYEDLKPIYQDAVNMRIDGFRYAAIAQHCKVREDTARHWFEKTGMLYHAYELQRKRRREESKELQKKVMDQLNDAVIDAIITLKGKARAGNVPASLGVLAYSKFQPTQKIELSQDPTRPVFYMPNNGRDTKDNKTTT